MLSASFRFPSGKGGEAAVSWQGQVLDSQSGMQGFSHSLLPVPIARKLGPWSRPRSTYLTHQESRNAPSEDKGWSLEPRVNEQRMVKFIKPKTTGQDTIQKGNQANTRDPWLLFSATPGILGAIFI